MKRLYQIIIIGFLSIKTSNTLAQKSIIYQPEQMQADLEKFKTALIKIHPGTYTHQSEGEFNHFVNDLMLETSRPMEATAFYRIVLKLIAKIHDGHTQAYTFGTLGDMVNNQKLLPIEVYVNHERIFIKNDLSFQSVAEGSEILAIDHHLSSEIIFKILAHYSSDGKSRNGMVHWLGGPYRPFQRIYPEIYGEKTSYNLVYRDYKTKQILTKKVNSITKETFAKRKEEKYPTKKDANEAFTFKINKSENYAYMKINRFIKDGYNDPENIYPDFYKTSFKEISNNKIQNLLIDLRDNGGGKASNAAYLLQYFINQPIQPAKEIYTLGDDAYYLKITGDSLSLNESFRLLPQEDGTFKVTKPDTLRDLMTYNPIKEYGYTGNLLVLINGGTTSAAGVAAGLLKEYSNGVFIGEETYGYAGISNGVRQISVRGDYTETAIYLPILHAEYAIDEYVQKRSVVPDYTVSHSIIDILNDHDAIMQFTLEELLPLVHNHN